MRIIADVCRDTQSYVYKGGQSEIMGLAGLFDGLSKDMVYKRGGI